MTSMLSVDMEPSSYMEVPLNCRRNMRHHIDRVVNAEALRDLLINRLGFQK